MQAIAKDGWVLTYQGTGLSVHEGDGVNNFRGEPSTITGGNPPHKPSSSGFVYTADGRELYPSVFGLEWLPAQ